MLLSKCSIFFTPDFDYEFYFYFSISRYFLKKSKLGGHAREDIGREGGIDYSIRKGSVKSSSIVALLQGSNCNIF